MKFIQYKRAGLCLTAAAILLTGCGGWSEENAADRTLALIRAAVSDDYSTAADAMKTDADALRETYGGMIEAGAASVEIKTLELSEESRAAFNTFFEELIRGAEYEAEGAVKTEDGFAVTVNVRPIDLSVTTDDLVALYKEAYNKAEDTAEGFYGTSTEEEMEMIAGLYLDSLKDRASRELYRKAVPVTVHVIKDGSSFRFNTEDLTGLFRSAVHLDEEGVDIEEVDRQFTSFLIRESADSQKHWLQAELDCIYKQEYMGFMKYYDADLEEARQEHDFNVRYIMQKYLLDPNDYSEEYVEKIYKALEKNMLNCKYTVDDVTGTNEGYAVTVIIEPLNMQGITSEIGRVLTENGGSRDEASVYNAIAQAMDNMASSPVYDESTRTDRSRSSGEAPVRSVVLYFSRKTGIAVRFRLIPEDREYRLVHLKIADLQIDGLAAVCAGPELDCIRTGDIKAGVCAAARVHLSGLTDHISLLVTDLDPAGSVAAVFHADRKGNRRITADINGFAACTVRAYLHAAAVGRNVNGFLTAIVKELPGVAGLLICQLRIHVLAKCLRFISLVIRSAIVSPVIIRVSGILFRRLIVGVSGIFLRRLAVGVSGIIIHRFIINIFRIFDPVFIAFVVNVFCRIGVFFCRSITACEAVVRHRHGVRIIKAGPGSIVIIVI